MDDAGNIRDLQELGFQSKPILIAEGPAIGAGGINVSSVAEGIQPFWFILTGVAWLLFSK